MAFCAIRLLDEVLINRTLSVGRNAPNCTGVFMSYKANEIISMANETTDTHKVASQSVEPIVLKKLLKQCKDNEIKIDRMSHDGCSKADTELDKFANLDGSKVKNVRDPWHFVRAADSRIRNEVTKNAVQCAVPLDVRHLLQGGLRKVRRHGISSWEAIGSFSCVAFAICIISDRSKPVTLIAKFKIITHFILERKVTSSVTARSYTTLFALVRKRRRPSIVIRFRVWFSSDFRKDLNLEPVFIVVFNFYA